MQRLIRPNPEPRASQHTATCPWRAPYLISLTHWLPLLSSLVITPATNASNLLRVGAPRGRVLMAIVIFPFELKALVHPCKY